MSRRERLGGQEQYKPFDEQDRAADDGGDGFWLTLRFPNGEELDVRVARTQLLQELLDIEADES